MLVTRHVAIEHKYLLHFFELNNDDSVTVNSTFIARINRFYSSCVAIFITSTHPLTHPHDLGVSGGPSSRWLRCEKGREGPGWSGIAEGLPGGAERCSDGAAQAVSGGSPRSRCWPVVVWKGHVCVSLRVWGTPRGRGRQENVFRSPVILHNTGQTRLELTAEDIQLDCACHSVASIRASPHAFVFAIAKRENAARSVFLCHCHFMSTPSSGLLHYFYYWMLHFKYWHDAAM